MKIVSRVLATVALAGLAVSLIGCAGNDEPSVSRDIPGQNRHSSMPHNLPQSWEGQGMLGGMAGYQ